MLFLSLTRRRRIPYMKALYKYPQAEFPYDSLFAENRRAPGGTTRSLSSPIPACSTATVILMYSCGVCQGVAGRIYMLIRLTICNRGPDAAELHLLPTLSFPAAQHLVVGTRTPTRAAGRSPPQLRHRSTALLYRPSIARLGRFLLHADAGPAGKPPALAEICSRKTRRTFSGSSSSPNRTAYVKDAFHGTRIHNRTEAVNPAAVGTKAAAHYPLSIAAGSQVVVRLRLRSESEEDGAPFGPGFEQVFADRIREADEFYEIRVRRIWERSEQRR